MKSSALTLILALSSPAFAQVRVEIRPPSFVFRAPPPLVVVEPGVQVVRDNDEEIFFSDGYYWHRREGHWFRTRTHTGGWAVVEDRYVPVTISRYEPGHYRHWRGEERREERREEKREEKHREHKREERREEHH